VFEGAIQNARHPIGRVADVGVSIAFRAAVIPRSGSIIPATRRCSSSIWVIPAAFAALSAS
jgi:hypothetical protein